MISLTRKFLIGTTVFGAILLVLGIVLGFVVFPLEIQKEIAKVSNFIVYWMSVKP